MKKYLEKALYLLTNFAKCDDKKIKILLCENEILQILKIFLDKFQTKPESLFKIIKIFKFISTEPTVLNALENVGLLPKVFKKLIK